MITLPTNQWVEVHLPHNLNDGKFGAALDTGGKHSMIALNPDNGRMYMNGGDYNGTGSGGSYRQQTFSFIPTDPNSWIIEHPECGSGNVQPKHPDFTGWFWDSKRQCFWLVPGVMANADPGNCPGETSGNTSDPGFDKDHLMQWSPTTKLWTSHWGKWNPQHGNPAPPWQSVYDPVNDTIIRPYCQNNTALDIINAETGAWSFVRYGLNAIGKNWCIDKSYLSVDYVARKIYSITGGRLYSISLDNLSTFADLGSTPQGDTSAENKTVWDSNNNVLIYHAYPYDWWAYDPKTLKWTALPNLTASGLTASGRIMGFDRISNCIIVWGQNLNQPNPRLEPGIPYMFLYRYGQQTGVTIQVAKGITVHV